MSFSALLRHRIFSVFCVFFLSLATVGALPPVVPTCDSFDNLAAAGLPGYWSQKNTRLFESRSPDQSGLNGSGWLYAVDDVAASTVTSTHPAITGARGDWMNLVSSGRCLKLCWDVILIKDGEGVLIMPHSPC